ncbi:hypothetical protein ACFLXI_07610 [Chloroflexota bacterium]
MKDKTSPTHKYSLAVYLLLANGITWLCWLPGLIIGLEQGYTMPNFDTYHLLIDSGFADTQHLLLANLFFLVVVFLSCSADGQFGNRAHALGRRDLHAKATGKRSISRKTSCVA